MLILYVAWWLSLAIQHDVWDSNHVMLTLPQWGYYSGLLVCSPVRLSFDKV